MRVLIVEDERVAARGLEKMTREILGSDVETLKIVETFTAAECFIQDSPVDLMLLDLNLHGQDGFEILKQAAAGSFYTIVVSANTDRAIEAFEYGVLDFVSKPLSKERLALAFKRVLTTSGAAGDMRYVSIKKDEKVELIPLSRIHYFQGSDNHVIVYCADGKREKHRKTLDSLERTLPPRFMRLHRSYIANLDFAGSLGTTEGGRHELTMKNGEKIPVSRSLYQELKDRIIV